MSLTDAKIRSPKPSDKPFKVSDSHGLYLLVKPGGSRHWYLKYRINGKESRIALGAYPAVYLSDARQMLALNINPAQQRAAERGACIHEKVFRTVALAWQAVLLTLHVFIRSSELRFARWSEIDFTNLGLDDNRDARTHYWRALFRAWCQNAYC